MWRGALRRAFGTVALLAALLMLGACETSMGSSSDTTASLSGRTAYFISTGDKLSIKVFDERDLTGEFQVDETGAIAFPLVGAIKASGLTLDEFRQNLIDRLKNGYVRNPRVTIDILNYRPINIIGEVRKAGQYEYRPGLSARDAIAIAGGYTYRANEDAIYIIRGNSDALLKVSLNESRFEILPGDTIKIPERFF